MLHTHSGVVLLNGDVVAHAIGSRVASLPLVHRLVQCQSHLTSFNQRLYRYKSYQQSIHAYQRLTLFGSMSVLVPPNRQLCTSVTDIRTRHTRVRRCVLQGRVGGRPSLGGRLVDPLHRHGTHGHRRRTSHSRLPRGDDG